MAGWKRTYRDMDATAAKAEKVGRTGMQVSCCPARQDVPSGSRQPPGRDRRGSDHEGETLQDPRCDRPDDSVQLGANLCARRNRCPPSSPAWSVLANRGTAAVCDCFGHLSCFSLQARGLSVPKRYYSPLARNLNPGDRIYLVVAAARGLINPNRLDNQLRDLRKLKPKSRRWESLTIPNQAPLGGFGEQKKGAEATPGPAARASFRSRRADSKGNTAQQYCPQLRPFDLRPDQKQTLKEVGVLVLPPSEGFWGFPPRFESPGRHAKSRRLGLNRKKWQDGSERIRRYGRYSRQGGKSGPDPNAEVSMLPSQSGTFRSGSRQPAGRGRAWVRS